MNGETAKYVRKVFIISGNQHVHNYSHDIHSITFQIVFFYIVNMYYKETISIDTDLL